MTRLLLPALAIVAQATTFADGGTVQLRKEVGNLAISADISLLIQNRIGLEPVLDADVRVILHEEISNSEFQVHPTRMQAQNKLLYAAPVIFSKPGRWHLAVAVGRNGEKASVAGTFEVGPAPARADAYAGYIAFPPVMIVLFVIRERLIRRKSRR